MPEEKRRLASFMLTDMAGYTALAQRDERLALELLEEQARLLRPVFNKHGGHEVKATGDGFLVEFSSALQATRCAIEIQKALAERNAVVAPARRIAIRIGLHVGDAVYRESDVFGDAVNITSRIEPLAEPGGICLSQQVYDQVWNKLEMPLVSLGKQVLKNVQLPMEVYRVVFPWEGESPGAAARVEKTRIAVIPLVNISPDPLDEYFTDGMTEELIYRLSKIRELKVIAQTSVMRYKGAEKTVSEIGRELRVGTVLEGAVRKADNKLRITVQLVDVQSEEYLWSELYERTLEDVFAIQDDIAQRVAEALQVQLLGEHRKQLARRRAPNVGAYTLYLTGRQLWGMRLEEPLRMALEQFQQAIELDPGYALAYTGLADCYSVMVNWGFVPGREGYPKAKEAVLKALELDDNLAEAHASLALIQWEYERKLAEAEAEFKQALELNPNYAPAHHWYALLLHRAGRNEEALAELEKALDLDPLSPIINSWFGSVLQSVGRLEEAKEQYRRTLELAPGFVHAHLGLGELKWLSWDWKGAEKEIKRAIQLAPDSPLGHIGYAYHLMALGRTADSLAEMEKAIALNPRSVPTLLAAGTVLYHARRYEEALARLDQALEEDPQAAKAHLFRGLAYARISRGKEAVAELDKAEELAGGSDQQLSLWACAGRGIAFAQMGRRSEAEAALAELMSRPRQIDRASLIGLLHFRLGQSDEGFTWAERAWEEHDPGLLWLRIDPLLDELRADQRYLALMDRMGLPPDEPRPAADTLAV
ncbi:MAG: tetratricopeptide repeat protein [Candidatus Acetothermia bacterium]|nr:tetratricopeptide repeat protein [Candidatus Acetothermia bacterium]